MITLCPSFVNIFERCFPTSPVPPVIAIVLIKNQLALMFHSHNKLALSSFLSHKTNFFMSETLRSNFSSRKHNRTPALRRGVLVPLSLFALLGEMNQYLNTAKSELLQPRSQTVAAILEAATGIQ